MKLRHYLYRPTTYIRHLKEGLSKPGRRKLGVALMFFLFLMCMGGVFVIRDSLNVSQPSEGRTTTVKNTSDSSGSTDPQDRLSTELPALTASSAPTTASPQATSQHAPSSTTKPKATAQPPAATPFAIRALSLTGSSVCNHDPDIMEPYTHAVSHVVSISIAPSYPGGTVTWRWEYGGNYTDMDGLDTSVYTQQIPAGVRQTTLSTFGDARSVDAEGISNNFQFRAVILSPNTMVSNWISTTGC